MKKLLLLLTLSLGLSAIASTSLMATNDGDPEGGTDGYVIEVIYDKSTGKTTVVLWKDGKRVESDSKDDSSSGKAPVTSIKKHGGF